MGTDGGASRKTTNLWASDHTDCGLAGPGEVSEGADSGDTLDLVLFLETKGWSASVRKSESVSIPGAQV